MKAKTVTVTLAVLIGLALPAHRPTMAAAQAAAADDKATDMARAREIVRKLRDRRPPTQEEVDLLERLLEQIGKTATPEAGPPTAKPPAAPEKRGGKPPSPLPAGLTRHSTKNGPVYLYVVDAGTSGLRQFWLDGRGQPYSSIARLEEMQYREGYKLQFAINGGIFSERLRPKGLYIEQGKQLTALDISRPGTDAGNFYLEPNGVFVVDSRGKARIVTTQRFSDQMSSTDPESIRFAVQSGPALLVDGAINPRFTEESANRKKRTGVGTLDDRRIVFAMSSEEISFYDFAAVFAALGCRDALYLDGGEVGAFYSRDDKLEIRTVSRLVTMIGVVEKLPSRGPR